MTVPAVIKVEDAEALFEILDNHIGVFKFEEMNDRATQFHWDKKQEFMHMATESGFEGRWWFQGFGLASAELVFDSTGLRVEQISEDPTEHEQGLVEKVNEAISFANFRFHMDKEAALIPA